MCGRSIGFAHGKLNRTLRPSCLYCSALLPVYSLPPGCTLACRVDLVLAARLDDCVLKAGYTSGLTAATRWHYSDLSRPQARPLLSFPVPVGLLNVNCMEDCFAPRYPPDRPQNSR